MPRLECEGRGLDLQQLCYSNIPVATLYLKISIGGSELFTKDAVQWSTDSFHRLNHLLQAHGGDTLGVHTAPTYKVSREEADVPWYKTIVSDFKVLTASERRNLPVVVSDEMKTVWFFNTFVIKTTKYLQWMMQRVRENGGLFIQQKVESLSDLQHYDVIVNCTGLASRELVSDESIFPVRGQIVIVKAPKTTDVIYHICEADLSCNVYTIPHKDYVLLGGTAEVNNWSTTPDPTTTQRIYNDCLRACPDLNNAEIVGSYACLRPVRHRVRLEREGPTAGEEGGGPVVLHNYGHGGQGFVLHWGCALDVVRLVQQALKEKGFSLSKM